jgi:hypothetical protein
MRYRLMASFQGASYQAGVGPSDEEVTLFAACPPPEELGFRSSSGHWRKRVSVDEIAALWEARPIGRYRGERCMVLDDLGERLHIAYLGRDLYMAKQLGFWEVDRGVFEVVVPRQEINELREERGEYELALLDPADASPPGSWENGHRETWASNPRDYGYAPDTGPLRQIGGPRELIDTGPSWPSAGEPGSWNGGNSGSGGWDARDEHAQDPRDTGTWAAAGDLDRPDPTEPRGRGGWRARDTGGWEAPDTGTWSAREVAELAAREGREGYDARAAADARATGGWSAREIAEATAREARNGPGGNGWGADAAARDARDALGPRNTGGWAARDVADAAARDAGDTGGWSTRSRHDTGDWNGRDAAGAAARDARNGHGSMDRDRREVQPGSWREPSRWDPQHQDTLSWNPVTAGEWEAPSPAAPASPAAWNSRPGSHARPPLGPGSDPAADWEPNEVLRPTNTHQRTPDAAAAWHGSPAPGDLGRWGQPAPVNAPVNGWGTPPRLAITGAPPAAPQAPQPAPVMPAEMVYDDPPLARETAAMSRAHGNSVGRHTNAGRRSGRRNRVTAQAVFSQLLEQASIPQSAYAIDAEVDGAMCLVHSRGGYEVFSSADRVRHEVRFFEDEEAAYFYLFGILAAEAIRNGQLGPQQAAPAAHRPTPPQLGPGYS